MILNESSRNVKSTMLEELVISPTSRGWSLDISPQGRVQSSWANLGVQQLDVSERIQRETKENPGISKGSLLTLSHKGTGLNQSPFINWTYSFKYLTDLSNYIGD